MTMPEDTTTPTVAAELPRISCGCGFLAVGADEENNRLAFEDHSCLGARLRQANDEGDEDDEDYPGRPWYSYVFSFWGLLIAIAITTAVVEIVNGGH